MWTSNAAQSENTGLLYSCLKQVTIYYTSFSLGQQEPRLDFVDASFLQGLVNCTNFIKKKKKYIFAKCHTLCSPSWSQVVDVTRKTGMVWSDRIWPKEHTCQIRKLELVWIKHCGQWQFYHWQVVYILLLIWSSKHKNNSRYVVTAGFYEGEMYCDIK